MYTQMTAHVQDCVVEGAVLPEIFNITHTQTGMTFFVHFKLQTVASDQNIDLHPYYCFIQ